MPPMKSAQHQANLREAGVNFRPAPTGWRLALRAGGLGLACGLVYLMIVGGFRFDFHPSDSPHHALVANAFLHGRLHVLPTEIEAAERRLTMRLERRYRRLLTDRYDVLTPAVREALLAVPAHKSTWTDWAMHDGRLYGYWAPLAPVVMLPCVAIWGAGVSDQVVSAVLGAINVALFYWLLVRVHRRGWLLTSEACRVALTLTLAFGTSHFWQVCAGSVWFAVQIVTLLAVQAALLVVVAERLTFWRWLLAGACFGCAVLGRNIVIATGLSFAALIWWRLDTTGPRKLRRYLLHAFAFGLPVLAAIGVQGWYNAARFGDPLRSGLTIQIETGGLERFRAAYEQHGLFSLHYVPQNVWYYFLNVDFPRLDDGKIWYDSDGNSLFLVTPPLLYMLLSWRRWSWFGGVLLAGALPLSALLMLYFATGHAQFGPRYLLDIMPLLLMLAAIGMRGRLTMVGYALVVLAIGMHLFGTYRFCGAAFDVLLGKISWVTLPAAAVVALLLGMIVTSRRRGRIERGATHQV